MIWEIKYVKEYWNNNFQIIYNFDKIETKTKNLRFKKCPSIQVKSFESHFFAWIIEGGCILFNFV